MSPTSLYIPVGFTAAWLVLTVLVCCSAPRDLAGEVSKQLALRGFVMLTAATWLIWVVMFATSKIP